MRRRWVVLVSLVSVAVGAVVGGVAVGSYDRATAIGDDVDVTASWLRCTEKGSDGGLLDQPYLADASAFPDEDPEDHDSDPSRPGYRVDLRANDVTRCQMQVAIENSGERPLDFEYLEIPDAAARDLGLWSVSANDVELHGIDLIGPDARYGGAAVTLEAGQSIVQLVNFEQRESLCAGRGDMASAAFYVVTSRRGVERRQELPFSIWTYFAERLTGSECST